jgi:hypothetical protein
MRAPAAAMIAILGIPATSGAVELDTGISSEGYWTDNVYSQSVGEVDDFSVSVAPWGQLNDPDGEVTWALRYEPSYEYWLTEDDVTGFDHDASGRIGWRITPRTTLRLGERYQRFHSLSRFNEQAAPGEDVVVAGRRVEYTSNIVNGGVEHWLTPRDFLVLNSNYLHQTFDEEGQSDRDFYGTSLVYRHIWSERMSFGVVGSWSRQSVQLLTDEDEDRETDYYNISGLFNYVVSPTLRFEASAGPAYISSNVSDFSAPAGGFNGLQEFPRRRGGANQQFLIDADTCPRNSAGDRILTARCQIITPAVPGTNLGAVSGELNGVPLIGSIPGADDSTTTYFADIALIKDWERWRGELSYTRTEDRSTGFGAVSDIFYGSLRFQVTRRLVAKLNLSYELRDQTNENVAFVAVVQNSLTGIPNPPWIVAARTVGVSAELVDNNSGLDVTIASFHLNYDLTPRSSVYAMFIYRDEQSDGDVFLVRDMQRFSVAIGINYFFDPIDL